MIPRGELDIDWAALGWAVLDIFRPSADRAVHRDPKSDIVSCLSVRSGLDALLSLVDWPTGSEILMSAVNITAMASIVVHHGFVPVPVDVSVSTLAPDIHHIEDRITTKTRAILVAHLFGSRLELGPLRKIADAHGVELWEDVAQGFHPTEYGVRSLADVSLFSFGLIKTHTALGGALIRCKDADRAARLFSHQSVWPEQLRADYRLRVIRALLLKIAGQHRCYTLLSGIITALGQDMDVLMSDSVRSFKSGRLLEQIRRRPCPAQLRLLNRRLSDVSLETFRWKATLVAEYRRLLPPKLQVGADATFPGHWVYPIISRQRETLRRRLWQHGFDATVRGSQLVVVPTSAAYPDWSAPQASEWVAQLIYLPLHHALTNSHIADIASIVAAVG